ncbi:MAG: response regulator, partial [Synergistaceae bacterium]|nr:response regulator [Synergistaceae bacterium]
MKTQSFKDFFLDANRSGGKGTAFYVLACEIFSVFATLIVGVVKFWAGNVIAGTASLFFTFVSAVMLVYCLINVKLGRWDRVEKTALPIVVIGFIFGLSSLFFLDGGINGGVPLFFILAVVVTPWMLEATEAVVMLSLEILAFGLNIYFAYQYPNSVNVVRLHDFSLIFSCMSVTITLGVLCLFYTYAFRKQQEKLDEAITEAKTANEAKSSFLNSMSHEIRTPMNSILGMDEMILREEDRPEIREYASVIQRSGRALLGIINDVLDFSKLQDSKMEIMPVRYDLSSLINDLVNIAAENAKKKSLTFTLNVDKSIPRILEGDEYHIRQVMLNILNNAIKYTERGGVTVSIGYEKTDDYSILLHCAVTDTGIGIKSDDLAYIFQPFEHLESTRRFSSDGSGLGLPIVQKLLNLMNSNLKVESVFHKGSTFSFDVPQVVIKWEPIGDYERAYAVSTNRQQGKKFMQSFQAPKAKVLVVDDADINLMVFANLLKKTKIKIDTASSGLEMLQMIRMNHYDMIFLDHRMPGMDGIEAFHAMKKITDGINFNTPVVALTANAVLGARQLYIDEGFSDYISKPIDTVRLEQVLLEYLPKDFIIKGEDIPEDSPENIPTPKVNEVSVVHTEEYSAQSELQNFGDSTELEEVESEEEDEYEKYKNIQGIDFEAAVTNCGTEDTFIQALEIFYNSLDKKADEIETYEREKDIKNYTVKVHALKSAARLVGALDLSADAKHLEEAGDNNDVHEIEHKTPALLSKYRSYKPILAKVFGGGEEDNSLPEISLDELNEMYSMIKGFAADFDLDNIVHMMEEAKKFRIPEAEREK